MQDAKKFYRKFTVYCKNFNAITAETTIICDLLWEKGPFYETKIYTITMPSWLSRKVVNTLVMTMYRHQHRADTPTVHNYSICTITMSYILQRHNHPLSHSWSYAYMTMQLWQKGPLILGPFAWYIYMCSLLCIIIWSNVPYTLFYVCVHTPILYWYTCIATFEEI